MVAVIGVKSRCQVLAQETSRVFNQIIETITRVALAVFEFVKSMIGRYVGFAHKLWSPGYSFCMQSFSRREDVLPYLRYIGAAGCAYSKHENLIKPFGLHLADVSNLPDIPGMKKKDRCLYDPQTKLKVTIAEGPGNEVIVSFGAVKSSNSETWDPNKSDKENKENQYQEALDQYREITLFLLGKRSPFFTKADEVFVQLKRHYEAQGKVLALSGQCLGGCIAQYVALKNKVKGYCFNCMPMGGGQQYDLGFSSLDQAKSYVTHISVKADYVSDIPGITIMDFITQLFLLRTPGNFGNRFSIPSAYHDMNETHEYFLGSVVQFLGYDGRYKKMDELPDADIVKFNGVQP